MVVSEGNLRRFYGCLEMEESSFGNASRFLEMVMRRVNGEVEEQ
jgi:hypothetical protein